MPDCATSLLTTSVVNRLRKCRSTASKAVRRRARPSRFRLPIDPRNRLIAAALVQPSQCLREAVQPFMEPAPRIKKRLQGPYGSLNQIEFIMSDRPTPRGAEVAHLTRKLFNRILLLRAAQTKVLAGVILQEISCMAFARLPLHRRLACQTISCILLDDLVKVIASIAGSPKQRFGNQARG